jgi:hypothetical protein
VSSPSAAYTDTVREKQQAVADQDPFVTTIDNDPFALPGTDNHHYNCNDMLKLGNNFAKQFFEMSTLRTVNIKCSVGGSIGTDESGNKIRNVVTSSLADQFLSYTLVPERGYELTSDSIKFLDEEGNVIDVQSGMLGNFFQFKVPTSNLNIEIEFKRIPQYSVSVSSKNGIVYQTNAERSPYRDETVTFTFKPNDGYELDTIDINGKTINASDLNADEEYLTYSIKVTSDIELRANFKTAQVDTNENTEQKTEQELKFFNTSLGTALNIGCKGSVFTSLFSLLLLSSTVLVLRKKRKN